MVHTNDIVVRGRLWSYDEQDSDDFDVQQAGLVHKTMPGYDGFTVTWNHGHKNTYASCHVELFEGPLQPHLDPRVQYPHLLQQEEEDCDDTSYCEEEEDDE
jgi:hypothetical protein